MRREDTLWVVVIVIALHVVEEYVLDFRGWIQVSLGLSISWELFFLVNAAFVVFAVAGAMLGWRLPEVSLMMPALIGLNGLIFHLGLTLVQRRLSPGTITSALLFIPVALWTYHAAYRDGVLTKRVLLVSLLGGALAMFYPLILLLIKGLN
jgi:hypothetical protein